MAGDVTREQVTWLYEVVTGGKDKPFVSNEPGSEGDVLASYLSGHGITLIHWNKLCGFSFSNIGPVYPIVSFNIAQVPASSRYPIH